MKDFNFQKHGDKLLFALALAVLAALLFRSLGKAANHAAAPGIVFTQSWQNDPEKQGVGSGSLQDLVKEFESLHGNIKVVLNERSYEDLRLELFNTAYADKKGVLPGDILMLDQLWVPELFDRGIIEEQREPLLSFINVFYYNIDILKKAGFTRPPKSRSEFLACARALNVFALTLGLNSSRGIYDDVFPWIWSAGVQLTRDGKPSVTARPLIESLGFLASLNSEGLIVPGAFSADNEKKLEDFISGRAAFMIAPTRDIALVRERLGDEAFGITVVPVPDNYTGKPFFAAETWTTGVHSGSAQKEEAGLFAAFLAGKASLLSDKARAFPGTDVSPPAPVPSNLRFGAESGNSSVTGRSSPQDVFYSKVRDIAISGEIAQDFTGLLWAELEGIFKEELSSLFEGKSSPSETAAAIQKKWEIALEKK